jgi:galactokinase/mevalonate kinase-like predicted kinase
MPPDNTGSNSNSNSNTNNTIDEPINNESSSSKSSLVDIIVSKDDAIRHQSLAERCRWITTDELLEECRHLDTFRRTSTNLYEKVRALFFLYAIHRFHLVDIPDTGDIPFKGYQQLLDRQFGDAIDTFLHRHDDDDQGPSKAISSALAKAYYHLGFQTLADQVRLSVQHHPGNAWMFQLNDPLHHPKPIILTLKQKQILRETTPVRMDLSHCGWSDIFFLGMDFPEGARVLNVSINLAVRRGQPQQHETTETITPIPIPPIETYLEVLKDEPVLKLTSIDLRQTVTLTKISEVFDFGKDYLGLLRAGIIASGIVPPGLEHSRSSLKDLFQTINHGHGLHLTTKVNDIPKGSRLAVSTNLLGSIISLGMRATGQTTQLTGTLLESERRLVAARAILGEWLGGSGGGWQDSGGVWPGIKLIEGVAPQPEDPEHGKSRGRLLPLHRQLSDEEAPEALTLSLQQSLILVHGGMAQNVGPVLEMVTEKYLLRDADEWKARNEALGILDDILECFRQSNIPRLAKLTTHNFFEPLQTIIPWASNVYTETLIERTRAHFADDFLGFWMLGGCSGGGMGFIFTPEKKPEALRVLQDIMLTTKREMETALPFAMDPVVYDFSINTHGTTANWCDEAPSLSSILTSILPNNTNNNGTATTTTAQEKSLDDVLEELGFDDYKHEKVRTDYKSGLIGLKQNRLSLDTELSNALPEDVQMAKDAVTPAMRARGLAELEKGTVGVVTLAAGVGSRWTQGAGCVKAIHPFCKLGGKHRSFVEIHLAKSRRISNLTGTHLPHVITTSYMTDGPLKTYLERVHNHGYQGHLYRSHGKSIGLRLIPTIRDLKFAWEETQQQKLDEQAQKVKESGHDALMGWAESNGQASDYRDNLPLQCLHPVGHFYEVPNILLSGTLQAMLSDRPQLQYLMLHNIDTVGADVDPGLLGLFLEGDSTLTFEVIPREIQDVGGGLARVDGTTRLIEGLALPREEDEFKFTYYNSMTTWIRIDKLLSNFGLSRKDLGDPAKVADALTKFSHRLPTYVALKDVKKRWGHGQEDVFPTAQFEKLWGDMTSLEDVDCQYFVVPRNRGAQLKDQAQLDGWLRDGSSAYLETICSFEESKVAS